METFCMNCGTPGSEWCDKCEAEYPGGGPAPAYDHCTGCSARVDMHCACSRGRAKAAEAVPDCDCRMPAPVRSAPIGADCLECAGCRGKVSRLRILEDDISVRD